MKKPKPWRKIATRILLEHERLGVNEDIVELPNGRRTTYVLQAPTHLGSVIMIAINDKNQVLLQKEYSYPPNEVMWQLPGGAMEEGESISEAANRELAEESGFKANTLEEIGFFYTDNRRSNQRQHIVTCRDLYPCKLPEDDDEFIETHWLPIQQVHKMIARGEFVNINLLAALNQWFHTQEKTKGVIKSIDK